MKVSVSGWLVGWGDGGGGSCWVEAVQGGVALETGQAGEVSVKLAGPQD